MTIFMRRHWLVLTLVTVGVAGTAWMVWQTRGALSQADPANARRDGRPLPVRTAQVKDDAFEQVIGATALTTHSLEAVIRVNSPSQSANRTEVIIKTILVREGQQVKAGQVLFELEPFDRREAVEKTEKAVAVAEAEYERALKSVASNEKLRNMELATAEAILAVNKDDLEARIEALDIYFKLLPKGSVTMLEYYEARSKRDHAQIEVKQAEHRVNIAKDAVNNGPLQDKATLEKCRRDLTVTRIEQTAAKRELDWCKVVSPIDGYIDGRVELSVGQIVPLSSPLARVIKIDPIHLRLDLPQEAIDEIALGQSAEIVLDSYPKQTFQGSVIRISPEVNSALRVLPVVVELANADSRIKTGISGFVRVRLKRQVKAVPAAAVIQQGSKAVVFCVEDGRARMREVKVKRQLDMGLLEVEAGLSHGDQVVVYFANIYRHWGEVNNRDCALQDNDPVDVDWQKWTRRN
jgi:RND family efflux transporter MFP subunit